MIIYKGKGIYHGWTSTADDTDTLLHITTRDLSQTTLYWTGYITLILGLAFVLLVRPNFYSWMATIPTTSFNLYAMQ